MKLDFLKFLPFVFVIYNKDFGPAAGYDVATYGAAIGSPGVSFIPGELFEKRGDFTVVSFLKIEKDSVKNLLPYKLKEFGVGR